MLKTREDKNIYLSQFERFEREEALEDPPFLRRIRNASIARFAELGFPTSRNEDWKFTNIGPIAKTPFRRAGHDGRGLTARDVQQLPFSERGLTFVNGRFAGDLSFLPELPPGVIVGSLCAALQAHSAKVEPYLARYAKYDEHSLTALNTAFIEDGAFVYVPKGAVIETPIHLAFVASSKGGATVSHPRNLIVVGENARVTIVERYCSLEEGQYFTNGVTEIVAVAGAIVDHCKLQFESKHAFHVATTQIHQDRGSRFSTHYLGLGGALVRNEVRAVLDAEGCDCTLNGLYLASGEQHMDNFTIIDHAKPHCASHELYKGILDQKARGVFNGKIFVRQDAQKTDAKQTNQTLLLSDDAVINTKPQLEIFADDVKCTHGATVGQLDADAIFYLRSRGIGLEGARSLLTYAFANEIISGIKVDSIRTEAGNLLMAARHLPGAKLVEEAV